MPRALKEEMLDRVASAGDDVGAFRMRRKDHLMNRWLKHAQISPFFIRLLRRGRAHYEREVNEVVRVRGMVEDLTHALDHYPFSKGLSHWIERHNRYSSMEASLVFRARRNPTQFSLWRALFEKDFNQRRFHQKELFYRLPARPLCKLLYMLVLRRAILDGAPGVIYSLLQTWYEWMIVLKTRELEVRQRAHVKPIARGQIQPAIEPSPGC